MKTKKLLLLIILPVFLVLGVKGQGYIPLVDTSKLWNVLETDMSGGTPQTSATNIIKIEPSDTIINDTIYKKVIQSKYNHNTPEDSLIGFIREDTVEKKVFFRRKSPFFYEPEGVDRLLYDFSIIEGDTIEVFGYYFCEWFSNSYVVLSTDSINLLNNEKRKIWNLQRVDYKYNKNIKLAAGYEGKKTGILIPPYSDFDTWIEGIGSLNGLINPGCFQLYTISFGLSLLCFFENEEHLYMHPGGDTCFIDWTSNVLDFTIEEIMIYPNPVEEAINISLPDIFETESTIQIISICGKIIYESTFYGKNFKIEVSPYNSGIYLLKIKNHQNAYVTKFVKK